MSVSRLQVELRQNKPFRSRAQEAALALYRTSDLVGRCFAKVIEPQGLSGEQYNILRILRGAAPRSLPTLEVADRMVVRSPAITRLLDKLEAKQLVSRRRCDRDRRKVFCEITPAGSSLLAHLDKPMDGVADSVLSPVKQQDLQTLIRILEQIRSSADHFVSKSFVSKSSEEKRPKKSQKENL